MRLPAPLTFALIAALTACAAGSTESSESYVESWWPASGRWVAAQWGGEPVPRTTELGGVTYVLDSARIFVGPGARALYILDSHTSEGYVGHDTLTGEFEQVGPDSRDLRLNLDSPFGTIWAVALKDASMIVIHAGSGSDIYVLSPP